MAQARTPADKRSAPKGQPLAAEEAFWERYSPHHEFPFSTVLAAAACAIALGLLLVLEVLHASRQDEMQRPPKMDAVEIEGGGGTDGPGIADGSGSRQPSRTETVENTKPTLPSTNPSESPQLKDVVKPKPLDVPESTPRPEPGDSALFDAIRLDAEKQVAAAMASTPAEKTAPLPTIGKNPGSGGGEGGGDGTGTGKAKGPGSGNSKFGQVLTRQQRHEMRWRLIFNTQDAQDHLDQLQALRITLAVPTAEQGIFQVIDLTRKPPVGRIENLTQQRDKVKWFNTTPQSLQGLAVVLRLKKAPQFVVIFLPTEMEETLARLERQYRNLPENQITLTEFEIRRRPDGRYTPEVISQR